MSKLIPNPKAEDKRNIVNNSQNAGNNNQNNRNNNNNQNRRNQGGHPQQQQRNDRGHNRNNGSGTYNLPDQTRNDDGYRQWKTNLPLMGAPTLELPEKPKELVKKFTGRCRLFVANLPSSITEDGLKELFSRFGEVSEVFLGKQNAFAFVKMDTRKNAEAARTALDLSTYENRTLRVRLAAHAAAVRVSNLSSMVSNDLLEYAFSYFGEVERAVVIADDRGRSTGEGIVEFARKSSALNALKRCQGENFILTAIPQPVVVEPFEEKDDEEGVADRHLNKNTVEYRLEREVGPRFADPGTFEYEFASRWKELFKLEKAKKERLDIEIQEARTKLREQMEYAKVEHQTKALREKLREMEEKTLSYGHIRESRAAEEKRREDERQRDELLIRQREEEILRRQQMGDYGNIRRQETDLMREANALQDLLDKQEGVLRQIDGVSGAPPPDHFPGGPQPLPVHDAYGPPPPHHQDPYGQRGYGVSNGAQHSPMEAAHGYGPPQGAPQWAGGPMGPIHGGGHTGFINMPPRQFPPVAGPGQKRRRY